MTAIGSLIMGVLNPEQINIPTFIPTQLSTSDKDVNFQKHQLFFMEIFIFETKKNRKKKQLSHLFF